MTGSYLDTNDSMGEQDSLDAVSMDPNGGQPPVGDSVGAVDPPDVDAATKANVEQWVKRIHAAKKHYEKRFKRMKSCQMIANEGRDKEWGEENYTVPILKRHINVSVAALYARNPTAAAKRKKKVQFQLWDGNYASLQQAMMAAQPKQDPATGAVMPGDPNAMLLLQEVQSVHQQNVMMDRVAKTMEILFEHFTNEPGVFFKQQLKAAVRRTKVCSVSWVELSFQRVMQPNPDVTSQLVDATQQLAHLAVLTQDYADGSIDDNTAKMDELRHLIADLQAQPQMIVREGPVFGFPKADQIIIDPQCIHLKTLTGADWVAREYPPMSRDTVKKNYGVDIGTNFKSFQSDKRLPNDTEQNMAVVWKVWNRETQESFVVCDGYPDFIKPPAAPDVKLSR